MELPSLSIFSISILSMFLFKRFHVNVCVFGTTYKMIVSNVRYRLFIMSKCLHTCLYHSFTCTVMRNFVARDVTKEVTTTNKTYRNYRIFLSNAWSFTVKNYSHAVYLGHDTVVKTERNCDKKKKIPRLKRVSVHQPESMIFVQIQSPRQNLWSKWKSFVKIRSQNVWLVLNVGSIRIYILTTGVVSNETNTYVRMYTWRIYSSRDLDTLLHKLEVMNIGKMQVYIHSQQRTEKCENCS